MISKPLKGGCPFNPAHAREGHILPDIIDRSNQFLLKKTNGYDEKSVVPGTASKVVNAEEH